MVLYVESLQVSFLPLSGPALGLRRKIFCFGTWGGVVSRELANTPNRLSLFLIGCLYSGGWHSFPLLPQPLLLLERYQKLPAESYM